ncbi:MAG: M20/M25/M40 family metallo-hydrolase, partial [Oscillochloris sp.]|nr:M20/M25/M40 family metallo-hydrolase [Oscillochloris sp.]
AAAEFVLAVETHAQHIPGLVATIGQLDVAPGASNVIPGTVTLSLDVRHYEESARLAGLADLRWRAEEISATRGLSLRWDEVQSYATVPMAAALRERLANAIATGGIQPIELPSGAGHDAAIMASLTEAAMLFVRCKGGISHHPAEAVSVEDVAVAIDVVGHFLDGLAGV